ncbi:MAG: DUF3052 domain-containing protein [Pseudomonadota bacterium]
MPNTSSVAGYSGTPLHRKLGLKAGMRYLLIGAPAGYRDVLGPVDDVTFLQRAKQADVVHLFCKRHSELTRRIDTALERVNPGGMCWVSWPKKSSPLYVDLTEDDLRRVVLPKKQWVDVKVCAVDMDWSALKFVRRRSGK